MFIDCCYLTGFTLCYVSTTQLLGIFTIVNHVKRVFRFYFWYFYHPFTNGCGKLGNNVILQKNVWTSNRMVSSAVKDKFYD